MLLPAKIVMSQEPKKMDRRMFLYAGLGAAVVVFEKEPIESDNPLLQMNNVIITPHIAWYSEESMIDQQRKTALNVKKVLSGEPPLYPVNI